MVLLRRPPRRRTDTTTKDKADYPSLLPRLRGARPSLLPQLRGDSTDNKRGILKRRCPGCGRRKRKRQWRILLPDPSIVIIKEAAAIKDADNNDQRDTQRKPRSRTRTTTIEETPHPLSAISSKDKSRQGVRPRRMMQSSVSISVIEEENNEEEREGSSSLN